MIVKTRCWNFGLHNTREFTDWVRRDVWRTTLCHGFNCLSPRSFYR